MTVALKFFCPTARQLFESGIWMDAETVNRQRLKLVSVDCPLCKRTHRFMLADARLDDEDVAS
ncbi:MULTISPECIES: hypothetical protein [Afipia]|uniref:Transposase-like protein n=1 Tax=Afipia massiliensis TaxID=211460 RepID=A0A840MVD6_9BRAD|nr:MULTISPECIES: hypothetical protein [Afipia]MBB5051883.1 transposase-like protein [Afipia massiliensis]MCR6736056.1 hypothetical protein [Afipia sp.]